MLPATLLSPSDNKPLQRALESILGAFTTPSDNATMPGHSTRAQQHSSSHTTTAAHRLHQLTRAHHRPPQATESLETQQNQAKIGHFLRENGFTYIALVFLLLYFYILYLTTIYHVIVYLSILYHAIIYGMTKYSNLGLFYTYVRPPLPIEILSPLFFEAQIDYFL